MKKRFKLEKHHSKKMFSKHGDLTHKRNIVGPRKMPMRGGIRM